MGYGPVINGKQHPITPWAGSWVQLEQAHRDTGRPLSIERPVDGQWPLGHNPRALILPGRYDQHGRPLPPKP